MTRLGAFGLIAAALLGAVVTVYASLRETPFFPASLQTTVGECPENRDFRAHRRPILERDEVSGFADELLALHEAPLTQTGGGRPTLRFSMLNDGVGSVTVRVTEVKGGRLHLTSKWLQGSAACASSRGCVVEKLLSPSEQARLEAAVRPLLGVPSYGCDGAADASVSILEASHGDKYRIWHQRSRPTDDLGAAGRVFLQLAEWPLADRFR